MKKSMRMACGLLAMLMLAGSVVSCAETIEPSENVTDTSAASQDAGAPGTTHESDSLIEETESEELKDDLPEELDFGNQEIVIISRDLQGWTSGEISVENLTSDLVNDAVYERNKLVEERLHVKINSILDKDASAFKVVEDVARTVRAGTHEYDIMAAACCTALDETLENTFADIRNLQHIDLEQPWWSQGFNEAVEYKGSQFAATGSAVLALYRFAFVTVFNKNIFNDANQPYLYENVKNGTWTLDRQIQLVPLFHRDDGNQVQDKTNDVYGFASSDYLSCDPYWSSCMVDIISKDENGDYVFAFDANHLHNVAEKTLALFYGTGQATYNFEPTAGNGEQAEIREMFASSFAAMATLRIMELENASVRNMTDEYGVIPMPKYDEAQDGYRTLLHDQFTVLCVPTTLPEKKAEMTGAFLEALSSTGYRIVRPVYYETTLRTKIAQDPESAEMMDVIIDNVYIDAGIIYTYALESFHDAFRGIMNSEQNTVISTYKGRSTSVERRKLPSMVKKLDMLID